MIQTVGLKKPKKKKTPKNRERSIFEEWDCKFSLGYLNLIFEMPVRLPYNNTK